MIRFFIPGQPRGKGRPRATARGGYVRAYTDPKTRAYEHSVRAAYQEAGGERMEGPLRVEIRAVFTPPQSLSKRRRAGLMEQPHTKKPDVDNITKSILDGLNGAAYQDDSAVAEIIASKTYGAEAGVEVTISTL